MEGRYVANKVVTGIRVGAGGWRVIERDRASSGMLPRARHGAVSLYNASSSLTGNIRLFSGITPSCSRTA